MRMDNIATDCETTNSHLPRDWGTAPRKRWLAKAELGANGRYTAYAPNRLEDHVHLIPSIRRLIENDGCAFVGFDFPIGIPAAYARLA